MNYSNYYGFVLSEKNLPVETGNGRETEKRAQFRVERAADCSTRKLAVKQSCNRSRKDASRSDHGGTRHRQRDFRPAKSSAGRPAIFVKDKYREANGSIGPLEGRKVEGQSGI